MARNQEPARYTVEGESLTVAEIVQRVNRRLANPLPVSTIRNRVERYGRRTWASLAERPEKSMQRVRNGMRQRLAVELEAREGERESAEIHRAQREASRRRHRNGEDAE